MKFKLIVALVNPEITDKVVEHARKKGATGEVIVPARGSGSHETKFFGFTIADKTDLVLFVVEEHIVTNVMDAILNECNLKAQGNGIAIVLSIDRVVGMENQIIQIKQKLKEENL